MEENDEEQKPTQKQDKLNSKQHKNNVKTPIKNGDKSKETLTPKAKTPKDAGKEKSNNKESQDEGKEDYDYEEDYYDYEEDYYDYEEDYYYEEDYDDYGEDYYDYEEDYYDYGEDYYDYEEDYYDYEEEVEDDDEKTTFKNGDKSKRRVCRKDNKEILDILQEHEERRREDDSCLLYAKLPSDVNLDELKALSPDIESFVPEQKSSNMGFLRFSSKAKTEAKYQTLQNEKIRSEPYKQLVGDQIENKFSYNHINRKILIITRIPLDTTIADIAIHFPKAYEVQFCESPVLRFSRILFAKRKDATEAFKLKEIDIKGQKFMIYHSFYTEISKWETSRNEGNANQPPAKKMRF